MVSRKRHIKRKGTGVGFWSDVLVTRVTKNIISFGFLGVVDGKSGQLVQDVCFLQVPVFILNLGVFLLKLVVLLLEFFYLGRCLLRFFRRRLVWGPRLPLARFFCLAKSNLEDTLLVNV